LKTFSLNDENRKNFQGGKTLRNCWWKLECLVFLAAWQPEEPLLQQIRRMLRKTIDCTKWFNRINCSQNGTQRGLDCFSI